MKKILPLLLLLLSINSFAQSNLTVNEKRLESRITELANFGKDNNSKGYRVAFTKGDIEARAWFIGLMKKAELEVSIDFAGNIIGKRKGKILH
jgi:N-carbamoyl-L-amino-acid hydrolase